MNVHETAIASNPRSSTDEKNGTDDHDDEKVNNY